MKKYTWLILVSFFTATSISAVAADNEKTLDNRLQRVERLVNSKGLVDIMVRVESIQAELQRLVGEMELQKHNLEGIKKRQRDLYLDIDRRLLQVERRSGTSIGSRPKQSPDYTAPVTTQKPDVVTTPIVTKQTNRVVKTAPVNPTTNNKPAASTKMNDAKSEQVAYQNAFDLMRSLRYDKATVAFRQFLNDYPDGRYAHIAQYWVAETSYQTRKFDIAVQDYEDLINKYPNSPKRADALLKIGYSQYELKAFDKSEAVLKKLTQTYPGTTEAGQAQNLLQKIRLQKSR